jgi:hypothetical protein
VTDHVIPFRRPLHPAESQTAAALRAIKEDLAHAMRVASELPDAAELDARVARALDAAHRCITDVLAGYWPLR